MPDLNELLAKLSNAAMTQVYVVGPRCLVKDNHGYLVTVKDSENILYRINPYNMTLIDSPSLSSGSWMNIAYYQEAYYVTRIDKSVLIINSSSLSVINTISHPSIDAPRDMIFLQNGWTMILASASNGDLLFFDLTDNRTRDYAYVSSINTGYSAPHGLWYVNDSFFYATSWFDRTIHSYSTNDHVSWVHRPITVTGSIPSSASGSHLSVDDCQRLWFSIGGFGIAIFASNGSHLGNFTRVSNGLFDAIFMDNYVMYLSDNAGGRIIRLDPNITC